MSGASMQMTPPNDTALPFITVIIPVYNESEDLSPLCDELSEVLEGEPITWEIIYCDDGSEDSTWEGISTLHKQDDRVRGIRLSRNFGHQYALLAGLTHAQGQAIISMDGDGQHPPKLIPALLQEWRKGNLIVHTVRIDNDRVGLFKKLSSRLFYRVYSVLSGVQIESGMADFRLLDRRVTRDILRFGESDFFLRGIVQWVGYGSSTVFFQARDRLKGKTKYSTARMLRFAWSGISSFSVVPLRLGILVGLVTSALSFGAVGYAIWARFYAPGVVPGWASAVSITSLFFGILFILLGILGDYVGRILIEVKRRPGFLVAESVGIDAHVVAANDGQMTT